MAIVDPYEYRDRLDIPKFVVTAAGDDFFVHDSIQFYLDELLNALSRRDPTFLGVQRYP